MTHNQDITQELLLLYELSLSIGQTLDTQQICRDFLRTLVARRNLTGASIWWGSDENESLELLHALPRQMVTETLLPAIHPLWRVIESGKPSISRNGEFPANLGTDGGASAAYPLGGKGILLMHSAGGDAFTPRALDQLRSVAAKLATAIEGSRAFRRLQASEANLRERTAQLADSQGRLRAIIDGTSDSIFVKDTQGRYVMINEATARFAGRAASDILGRDDTVFFSPESAARIILRDCEIMAGGKVATVEESTVDHTGATTVFLSAKGPLFDESGNVIGLFGISRDITERKREEAELARYRDHLEELVDQRTRELREATRAAEAASQAKGNFLANMSHEIRTPLHAISGMAYLIRRDGLTERQAGHMEKLERANTHLLGVINAILELTRIESGNVTVESLPLRVESIIENVVAMLREQANIKGLPLSAEGGAFPAGLRGDATRLQQALLNYVSNAIKFTDTGGVRVRARVSEEDAAGVTLRFEVEDSGIGIAPDVLQRLFSDFEQADNTITRRYGGTGLGLAITRKLAHLMGGEAGAQSIPGNGSVFWFTARLKKGATTIRRDEDGMPPDERLRSEFAGHRVLVAEDDPVNRELARHILGHIGQEADCAEDGAEAVAMAARKSYDLILMDVQMPLLDGLSATRKIRALPDGRQVVIVAMTGNAFAEDRALCMEAGMDDFLAKPVSPEALFETLVRWYSVGKRAAASG